jgi:hypothetical protein
MTQCRTTVPLHLAFGLRHSFVIGHSSFVILAHAHVVAHWPRAKWWYPCRGFAAIMAAGFYRAYIIRHF